MIILLHILLQGSPGHLYSLYIDAIPEPKISPDSYDQRYSASYSGSTFIVRTQNYPLSASNIITGTRTTK